MWRYIVRRVLLAIVVLLLVSIGVFSIVRLLPGDAVILTLGEFSVLTPEALEDARHELGIDRPFINQFGTWIGGVVRGDLGDSLVTRRSVAGELGKRVTLTLHLAVMAMIVGLLIAIPIGIISAVRQDTPADYGGRMFAIMGLSLPDFWMAVVAITFLTIVFQWFPPRGFEPIWIDPWKNLQQLFLPALIIGWRFSAVVMRMTRSCLLEVLREDYIRTAQAKGLGGRAVIVRHALKNALIPVVTIVGQQFSLLIGGTVIVEFIFLLPGVGSLTLDSVLLRDYTMIQGAVLFFASVMVLMNLLVDLSYAWFDPRIRYG
jgi:peptide/nickel transport system permease protein